MPAGESALKIHTLYSEHHGWLQGWLRRRLGNGGDAADLAHDTFVRILVSGRTPEPEHARPHLTQIAKGLAVDLHRRRVIEAAYLDALMHLPASLAPSAEERASLVQDLLRIDAVLNALPAKVRDTFLLSQLDGLTYTAIAQRMGLSVGAVRKYMLRAAQALHLALGT